MVWRELCTNVWQYDEKCCSYLIIVTLPNHSDLATEHVEKDFIGYLRRKKYDEQKFG